MTVGMLNTGAKIVKLAVLGLFATDVLIAASANPSQQPDKGFNNSKKSVVLKFFIADIIYRRILF
jgi:hypothetical protein